MTTLTSEKRKVESPQGDSILLTGLKYLLLCVLDAIALVIIYGLWYNAAEGFAVAILIATVLINVIVLVPGLYPLRWMAPGLFLVIVLVIYPIFYTVTTAFTNYGDGHLFTKQQTINLITRRQYVPADAQTYSWVLFRAENDASQLALWLTRTDENGDQITAFAPLGADIVEVEGAFSDVPPAYEGYLQVPRAELAALLGTVQSMVFGAEGDTAQVRSGREAARPLESKYTFDAEQNALVDLETGVIYSANEVDGYFQSVTGERLDPGYSVNVGFFNFTRFFSDPRLQGPLTTIFIWTVMFAFLSVFTTFTVGLFMAIILSDPRLPAKKLIRSFLIIPYAMPGVISIVVWRGMLNQNLGIITNTIAEVFGVRIPWFDDPTWARVAIILVNLWLGYPYMMLICSGALSAIPSDIYEAAAVDGASPWERFWKITLPLLLVTVGPLLIASFVYNFNNYLLIEALTTGNPPIPDTPTPAGYTDILISYTYRLAFGNSRGADYGYASAITIIIFFLVAAVTMVQYRFTKQWEEVGENV